MWLVEQLSARRSNCTRSKLTYSSRIDLVHGKNSKRSFPICGHCAPWPVKMKPILGAVAASFAKVQHSSLSQSSRSLVDRNARCQSLLLLSESVYARSAKLTLTLRLIKWSVKALILARRDFASFAESTSTDGRGASASSSAKSSKSARYDEVWLICSVGAASMIACAFEPPNPNEFTEARLGAPAGHGMPVRDAKTLFPVKSTTAVKLVSADIHIVALRNAEKARTLGTRGFEGGITRNPTLFDGHGCL